METSRTVKLSIGYSGTIRTRTALLMWGRSRFERLLINPDDDEGGRLRSNRCILAVDASRSFESVGSFDGFGSSIVRDFEFRRHDTTVSDSSKTTVSLL